MKRRNFIRKATFGSIIFSGLTSGVDLLASEKKSSGDSKLKDKFWLWAQNAGSHHGKSGHSYNLPGKNIMGPREGCDFFGIEKCCRVTMGDFGPFPPFDDEAEKFKDLKEVVWSAIGDSTTKQHNSDQSDIDEVLRIAEMYPNITGAILDDFFHNVEEAGKSIARHSPGSIRNMQEKLHKFRKRRLDLWVVWYTHQLGFDLTDYLGLFDVLTLWTWKGSDLNELDQNIKKFINKTPNKRHLAGCYMWNYGEKKPLTMDQMKFQLDRYYYWLKKKQIEGIIFCSNCIADIGLETVEYTRKWIYEIGKENI